METLFPLIKRAYSQSRRSLGPSGQRGASLLAALVALGFALVIVTCVVAMQSFWTNETRVSRSRGDAQDYLARQLTQIKGRVKADGLATFLKNHATTNTDLVNPPIDRQLADLALLASSVGLTVDACTTPDPTLLVGTCTRQEPINGKPFAVTYTVGLWTYTGVLPAPEPPEANVMKLGKALNDVGFLRVSGEARGLSEAVSARGSDNTRLHAYEELIVAF